nr:4Fe-4S dicluster domain-containing protein [Candidatus Njordarchaeota archaeon]
MSEVQSQEKRDKVSPVVQGFMNEVASSPRGEGILYCYQCGRCSGGCPVSRIVSKHNPRRLMEKIILGFKDEVLSTDLPWYCLSCFTCVDRCPQGADVGEVMFAIRNIAVSQGNVPKGLVEQARNLLSSGQVVPLTHLAIEKRRKLGLPKIEFAPPEVVQNLLKKTRLGKLA